MLVVILSVLSTLATRGAPTALSCPGATTTGEENACLEHELAAADADLARYRRAAESRIAQAGPDLTGASGVAEVAAAFQTAETAWGRYRDAECAAVFDSWSGGTIRVAQDFSCRIHLSRLHAHTLWREWLTYFDSTPPTLPEPTVPAAP